MFGRQASGDLDALLEGPKLPGPAGGQGTARHHIEQIPLSNPPPREGRERERRSSLKRDGSGAVAGTIVHQDDSPFARIVLLQERADASPDALRFIARRDDDGELRPVLNGRQLPVIAL